MYHEEQCPIWIDFSETIHYGFPATDARGFKVANDARGGPIDPTTDDRAPSAEQLDKARAYLGERFPGLAGAPLLETRVCQYANTADGHLLIDRSPADSNTWLVGGGSGHGFKLGPVLGEFVARLVLGDHTPPAVFALGRQAAP
jgi:glycine/D-amino acid oxidase-like deaminating enzyme